MARDDALGVLGSKPAWTPKVPASAYDGAEGRDVVDERAALAQVEEEAAAHPVAEDRAEQVERPAVGIVARHARHAEAQVALAEPPIRDAQRAGRRGRRRRRAAAARPAARRRRVRAVGRHAGAGPHDVVVVDRAGDGQHHAPTAGTRARQWSTHARRGSRAARDPIVPAISRPSGWLAVHQLVEQGEDVVGRRVDVHPDLVDDDRLLGSAGRAGAGAGAGRARSPPRAPRRACSAGTFELKTVSSRSVLALTLPPTPSTTLRQRAGLG